MRGKLGCHMPGSIDYCASVKQFIFFYQTVKDFLTWLSDNKTKPNEMALSDFDPQN